MDIKTVSSNDFTDREKAKILDYLDQGSAVHFVADCIGHTRAWMCETAAERFFKEIGAKPIEIPNEYHPEFVSTYYIKAE